MRNLAFELERESDSKIDKYYLFELLKNSWDSNSYAAYGKSRMPTDITIRIYKNEQKKVIRFDVLDSGTGFTGLFDYGSYRYADVKDQLTHQTRFTLAPAQFQLFGGNHLGLQQTSSYFEKRGGTLYLQNLNRGGARVSVVFDPKLNIAAFQSYGDCRLDTASPFDPKNYRDVFDVLHRSKDQ